jgi:4-amino-4-deoxy-L-arabinose transferase-like glycosyltransferase
VTVPYETDPASPASHRRRALSLGLLALTLHLIFVFGFARFWSELGSRQLYDQGYDIARNWVEGRGYLEVWYGLEYRSWRPPLFPGLMALSILLFGPTLTPIKVMLALFGALTVVTVYYLARRLFGDRTALVAGLAAALNPSAIFASAMPEPSNLVSLLLTGAWLAMLRARDGGLRESVLAGAVIATAMLTKTFYLIVPVIAIPWLLIQKGSAAMALKKAAVMWAVVIVMFSPWVLRNYRLFDTFRITTTDTSLVFWVANSPSWLESKATEGKLPPVEYYPRYAEFGSLSEIERDRWMKQDAWKTVVAHKQAYIKRVFERIWLIWKPFIYSDTWNARSVLKTLAMGLSYAPILVFFLLSVYLLRNQWRTFILPYTLIAALTASFALVHGVSRYRISLEPLLIVQGAYAFNLLLTWWSSRRGLIHATRPANLAQPEPFR